jgi:hypothetical protein
VLAVKPADLLEIGELGDFHPIAPDFPAQAPGAERGAFPVVLDKADVVRQRIDADLGQAGEVQLLQVFRVRLQDDLVLVIVLQPVRVLAVTAVGGPARGLDVGGFPRLRPERAQRRGGMKRPRAHPHVVRLQDQTALRAPEAVEAQDHLLKGKGRRLAHRRGFGAGLGMNQPSFID